MFEGLKKWWQERSQVKVEKEIDYKGPKARRARPVLQSKKEAHRARRLGRFLASAVTTADGVNYVIGRCGGYRRQPAKAFKGVSRKHRIAARRELAAK